MMVWGQYKQKVTKTPPHHTHTISTNKLGMVADTCDPSYVRGVGKRIKVQGPLPEKLKILPEK
jgi:hypothetical protein